VSLRVDRSIQTLVDTFTGPVVNRTLVTAPGEGLQFQLLSVLCGKRAEATNWPEFDFLESGAAAVNLRVICADDGGSVFWEGSIFWPENTHLQVTTQGSAAGTIHTITLQYRVVSTSE